jgi:pyruvate dehydrogenase E1 component alpha subunit
MSEQDAWLLGAYRDMCRIRRFEEQSIEFYKAGLVGGSLHPYIGQEAVAVGMLAALEAKDQITMTYRGRAHALAKGAAPHRLFAEILGRADGLNKGKGGPMHIADPACGVMGANAIVAGGIPIAVGLALAMRMRREPNVVMTFFGDGTVNQGAFHEALNLAAVWQVPVVFVCENNLYSEMSPIHEMVRIEHLADRAAAYGIPGAIVDGNDVEAVRATAREAVARARVGGGPTFVEAKTYRLAGHMFGDPERYRSAVEVETWRARDPIALARGLLIARGASDDEVGQAERAAQEEIQKAARAAEASPEPDLSEALTDVF